MARRRSATLSRAFVASNTSRSTDSMSWQPMQSFGRLQGMSNGMVAVVWRQWPSICPPNECSAASFGLRVDTRIEAVGLEFEEPLSFCRTALEVL